MLRRSTFWIVVLALVFSVSASLSAQVYEEWEGDLLIWKWGGPAQSLQDVVVPAFEEAHPNVNVEFVSMGHPDVHSRLLTAFSAGTGAPDVSGLEDTRGAAYASGLADLTEYMAPYADKFVDYKLRFASDGDRIIGVPFDGGPVAMVYRRDTFERYGYPSDPAELEERIQTWDDLIEVGKDIYEQSNGRTKVIHMSADALENLGRLHQIIAWSAGSGIFDADGQVVLDNEVNIKAAQVLGQILDHDLYNDATEAAELMTWRDGTVATYAVASWFRRRLSSSVPDTAGQWGVFRLPALYEGGPRASNSGGSMFVIPEQARDKDLAFRFLEFALLEEANLRSFIEAAPHLFPAYIPFNTDPEYIAMDAYEEFFGGQNTNALFAEIAAEVPDYNFTRHYFEAENLLNDYLNNMRLGRMDAEQAMTEAAAELRERLGQ